MIWAGPRGQYPRFSLIGPWDYNASLWHQKSQTSQYDDSLLFTIKNICFQGAQATNISRFWYPQSCQAVMLMLMPMQMLLLMLMQMRMLMQMLMQMLMPKSMIWAGPRGQYPRFSLLGIWDYVCPKNVILAPAYQNVTI